MKRIERLTKKALLLYGAILLLAYLIFRVQLINISPALLLFSFLLFLAELHTIIHFFGMVYSLWPRKYERYPEINYDKNLQINLLVCVCGEPAEIVRETVLAAKETAKKYESIVKPHQAPRVVILNDGFAAKKENWFEIQQLAKELNVYHVVRETSDGFKAGNINNGLKMLPSTDSHNTIDIVFDADFSALPDFLLEITKPFTDDNVDFVQTPQRYKNERTWVAKASAAHQIYFFDYVCDAKAYDNALFLCGTNFAIRRKALEDIGGMDTNFITEDYATSLNLHMAGKKGVFVKKPLALGIAPSTLKAYFSQQRRWSKGTFDTSFAYLKKLVFGNLTWKQKFHYLLSATYYFIGVRDLILMIAPVPYLYFGVSLIRENTVTFLMLIYGPMLIYNFVLYLLLFREPLKSMVLDMISFPVFAAAFFSSALKRELGFIVTIKKYEKESILQVFQVYKVQLIAAAILSAGLYMSMHTYVPNRVAAYMNYFWASFDVAFLSLGFILMLREYLGFAGDEITYSLTKEKITSRFAFPVRYALVPALTVLLVVLLVKSPFFKTFANQEYVQNVIDTAQGKSYKEELLAPSNGVYYGYYIPDSNRHPEKPNLQVIPGEKPSITMYYQDWGERPGFDNAFANEIVSKNIVPIITWEPWDIRKVQDNNDIAQNDYAPKLIADGKYDQFIRTFAKDAAQFKHPFYLRFAHEMNGNWYPWGNQNGNTPEDYIAMWRHVHSIFEEEGATNAIWVWSPNNTDAYGNSDTLLDYYPGDEYVDWVAFSGFNWGQTNLLTRWTSFKTLAYPTYEQLVKLGKPIMIAETSSASYGGDKTAWFIETLKNDIPSMPRIKAVIFFHDDSRGADFSLLKGMQTYKVIHENVTQNGYYLSEPLIVKRETTDK